MSAFEWIYQKLVFILGGMLIPLDFFPAWLQKMAQALPFPICHVRAGTPVRRAGCRAFLQLPAGQAAWLVALGGLLALAYRGGVRRLSVNGG